MSYDRETGEIGPERRYSGNVGPMRRHGAGRGGWHPNDPDAPCDPDPDEYEIRRDMRRKEQR